MLVNPQPSMLDTYLEFNTSRTKHVLNEHKVQEFQTWAGSHMDQAALEINLHESTIRNLQADAKAIWSAVVQLSEDLAKARGELDRFFDFTKNHHPEVLAAYQAMNFVNKKFDEAGKQEEMIYAQAVQAGP